MLESDICAAAAETPDGMTATRDLQRAIAAGDFPQYNFFVQALDPGRMHSLGFYPLDATKVGAHVVVMCRRSIPASAPLHASTVCADGGCYRLAPWGWNVLASHHTAQSLWTF
jgi:hypothetical protein